MGQIWRGRKYTIIPAEISDQLFVEIGLSKSGKPRIVTSDSSKDWLAFLSSEGCYTRGTYRSVYVPENQTSNVKVVASGYGAYGAAWRTGEFWEFLLEIQDETFVLVKPSGGEHKIPAYWLYFGKTEVKQLRQEELDVFCESFNLESPEGRLVDLVTKTT